MKFKNIDIISTFLTSSFFLIDIAFEIIDKLSLTTNARIAKSTKNLKSQPSAIPKTATTIGIIKNINLTHSPDRKVLTEIFLSKNKDLTTPKNISITINAVNIITKSQFKFINKKKVYKRHFNISEKVLSIPKHSYNLISVIF